MPGVVAAATVPRPSDRVRPCGVRTTRARAGPRPHCGNPIAAVAARRGLAFYALDAIEVEYEPLPPIGSIDDAVSRPEPRIHDYVEPELHNLVRMSSATGEGSSADRVSRDRFFYGGGDTHSADHCRGRRFGPSKS